MIFNKKFRNADKEMKNEIFFVDSDDDALINVKVVDEDSIFSQYNYDGNEKIKEELSEFIYDKARFVPAGKDIRIKVFTNKDIDEQEIKTSIKNNYKHDYIEIRSELKHNVIFSVIMLFLGLAFLSLLLAVQSVKNVYLNLVLEIATWVFLWEAVDAFILKRTEMRIRRRRLLKLYCAEIEVVKLKDINKIGE